MNHHQYQKLEEELKFNEFKRESLNFNLVWDRHERMQKLSEIYYCEPEILKAFGYYNYSPFDILRLDLNRYAKYKEQFKKFKNGSIVFGELKNKLTIPTQENV